jgi:peptidyl-dipeptidase Dcp
MTTEAKNPFLEPYNTTHQTIPFNDIALEHYFPAFEEAMKQQKHEIEDLIHNPQAPSFENTIERLEHTGDLMNKVSGAFYNMLSSETNDSLQAIAEKLSPILAEHSNSIRLNQKLFERVKAVYSKRDDLNLNIEQQMLLKETYDGFANNGANLSESDKAIYKEITKELSLLSLQYGQNVLKETNKYSLLITDKSQLAGLPDDVLEMLAENAQKSDKQGWLLNLKTTTIVPFMKYADNRDLRKELYMANATRCMSGGEFDNRDIVKKLINLRLRLSNLLGYSCYADYALIHRMAEKKENVYELLDQLRSAYMPIAEREYQAVQSYANKKGADFKLQPWDWSYYAEKLKDEMYSINDEILRPYFELERVKTAVFDLASKLYGLKFKKSTSIQVYHKEVESYEVLDENDNFLAVLYTDFHPRDSKRSGAWMSEFKGQNMINGVDSRPHITIVMNFTRPTASKPALLTFDELTTLLHEFGHALHGMLTKCHYESLSGTNVYRDFVELPSQIMENWASEKEFLDGFAVHYQTGEKIPLELIQKIKASENYNVAYFCVRQLSFGYLDMAWHTIDHTFEGDVISYEKQAMASTQILPSIANTGMSPTFGHIFSGGYSAGYYSYKWSEVLDADAFSMFAQKGIFDKTTANSFRTNILEKGGTEHPMVLYKRFRGQAPTIDALLKRNGITK